MAILSRFTQAHPPESFRINYNYPNVELVELSDALCSQNACRPDHGLHALYADGNHISTYAANTIITAFLKDRLSDIMPVAGAE